MKTIPDKIRTLTIFIGLSILVHLLVLFSLGRFGNYVFAAPVTPLQAVMVDLTKPSDYTAPVADFGGQETSHSDEVAEEIADDESHTSAQEEEISIPPAVPEKSLAKAEPVEPVVIGKEKAAVLSRISEPAKIPQSAALRQVAFTPSIIPPLRTASEFLATKSEKLTYLISLHGIPVGSAELEAKNDNGEIRITLRTRSNATLSSIYPVDDIIETRHIGGNIIITKVSQQEGAFKSDIGFTIFLRNKRVFWLDRIRKRYSKETIPNSEVLDTLSSFYYLRNRPLQTGKTELLHIYDGDTYAPVPVEIVRKEEVRLRNFRKVDTLLLRHIRQNGGIFRRTGDMLIWLSNDANKVPVKMETTIPLGTVTAELVSAESILPEQAINVKSMSVKR